MAEEKEQILIEVKFDTSTVNQAKEQLAAAISTVNSMKDKIATLNKEIKANGGATAEQAAQMADYKKQLEEANRSVKSNTAILQASTSARKTENDSLDAQRQYLAQLQKAYASLTKEQKDAMGGQEALEASIKAVSDSIKEQEQAIGDSRRNVGNYGESIRGIFPAFDGFADKVEGANKMVDTLSGASAASGGPLKVLVGGIGNVTKAAMKFIATPIGAVIAAIVVAVKLATTAFGKIKDAIAKSDDASTAFANLYEVTVQPAIDVVNKALAKLAKFLGDVAAKLADFFGKAKDGKPLNTLANNIDKLEEKERQYEVNSAKRNYQIAELKNKAAQKDKFTAQQRIAALQEAAELEKQNLKDQEEIAERKLAILKRQQQREQDTSDEMKNQLAEAEAELYRVKEQSATRMRELETQQVEARAQIRAEEEARKREEEEKRKKREEEQRKKEQDQAKEDGDKNAAQAAENATKEEEAKLKARQEARAKFGLEPEKTPEEQELELLQEARAQDLLNAEEYEIAKTQITEKYSKMRQEEIDAEVQRATELYQKEMMGSANAASAAMSALGDLVGAFAEDSEEASKAQKAFAFGSILINQAMAIAEGAKGIAAAMAGAAQAAAATGPAAPIMLGIYQAQMVGQVLAMVASVASTIVQSKQIFAEADAGNYADGGIVPGTSYSGDRMIAHVNSREMIMPMSMQQNLFDALSSGTDGNRKLGIDYELMAAANAALPAPVVVYRELEQFGDRVATYNEIASI